MRALNLALPGPQRVKRRVEVRVELRATANALRRTLLLKEVVVRR